MIKYRTCKGTRRKKNSLYCGVTTFDGYWFVDATQTWVHTDIAKGERGSHFNRVYSVRAFRRRLRQWSKYLPKGITFILASRDPRFEVYGTT